MFEESVVLSQYLGVHGHSQLTNGCSERLKNSFGKVIECLCIINFGINLHVQDGIADGENDQENAIGEDEWNEINDTEDDHLHQETISFENSDEEKKLDEGHHNQQKFQLRNENLPIVICRNSKGEVLQGDENQELN